MNILILGSGIVGANLAKKLSEQGKNVFLLDDDANELKKLSERFDIKTINDDPLNPSFYKNFDSKIDCFIAVTRSDEKNIITSKFAKEFLKVDKSIARVRNQNLIEDLMNNSIESTDLYDLNFREAKDKFEKDYLLQKLKINNFNMSMTAKMLKLDRVSLYRKVKSLKIKID